MKKKLIITREQGAAFILAVIGMGILAIMGASFAFMLDNEAKSHARKTAYDQALFVAEAGIEDVLYQRSKNQSDLCFPYSDDGTLTGAAGEINGSANGATCDTDPDTDADPQDPGDDDVMPCWPYNEKLYANELTFGPNFYCNDGSDSSDCPTYRPLAVWPAGPSGGVGWKDMEPQRTTPLPAANQSSGMRYTTGLFTVCNDDFIGDDTSVEPAKSQVCLSGPPCNRSIIKLSIVSVGEVETRPKESVQRAVKVDIIPPALYSGVIDKYIDLTLMYETNINGPVHINGWWNSNQNRYDSILLLASLSFAPILAMFDPPEVISVSYPEDPANPDWQPPLALGGNITYIHLPVRIEIPEVNWKQFEDRMKQLYSDALAMYGAGNVETLKMEDYLPGNMYYTAGDGSPEYDCEPGGIMTPDPVDEESDECTDAHGMFEWCESGGSGSSECCSNNAGPDRIHNCRRNGHQVWSNVAFDLYDLNTTSWVTGSEPGHLGGGGGPRDRSLRPKVKTYFELHLGGACSISNPLGCLSRDVNRPQFVFMGRHEFAGKVFIDGTMGIGTRTPYHTCGPGDGPLSVYCIIIDLTIITIAFGFPHWHTGNIKVTGELLVNGQLFMADYIKVDGGAIYADDHIIKDETSGFDIILNLADLLCTIFSIPSFACAVVQAIVNPLISAVLPWWPTIDLSNDGIFGDLIGFDTFLDIDGWNTAGVINSGTIYTRGDFRYDEPAFDLAMFIGQQLISWILGNIGLSLVPALDPIRIWNNGAIVAGGRELAPGVYENGNIYLAPQDRLDVLVSDPDGGGEDVGFMFARGSLQVNSDIIHHHSNLFVGGTGSCNNWLGLDEDCDAAGIFYSGGGTAGTADTNMFTSEGGTLYYDGTDKFKSYKNVCLHPDEPGFWADILDNILCWEQKTPILCSINGNCDQSEFNIRGFVFAGQMGGNPMGRIRLDQDESVLHNAVTRRYYKSLAGVPVDWMEIEPPANIPKLN